MFASLVSVALFSTLAIQGARADFSVDTPTLVQCQSVQVKWDSTNSAPYNLIVVPAAEPCGDVLADLGDHNGTSMHWTVNLAAGTQVMFSLQDAVDDEAWSGGMTVQPSNDSSCLSAASSSAAASSSSAPAASSAAAASSVDPATTLVVPNNVAPSPTDDGAANSGILGNSNGALGLPSFSAPLMALSTLAAVFFASL
ncbi:hypothetical protein CERSUDRAFT_117545 [Gelatoporia subvermispora B]|uniref:Uncharacterized protein n=1 Tax=Ceriporiopsis subvermispora (strain B) TaxID=914234 RepID=M2QPE5_CERS8|nr:hypothetical protein CERSUDRAFT_117545 [Gelatoporia subvermispora B]